MFHQKMFHRFFPHKWRRKVSARQVFRFLVALAIAFVCLFVFFKLIRSSRPPNSIPIQLRKSIPPPEEPIIAVSPKKKTTNASPSPSSSSTSPQPTIPQSSFVKEGDDGNDKENSCAIPKVEIWNSDVTKRVYEPMPNCSETSAMGGAHLDQEGKLHFDKKLLIDEILRINRTSKRDKKGDIRFNDHIPGFEQQVLNGLKSIDAAALACTVQNIPRTPGDKIDSKVIRTAPSVSIDSPDQIAQLKPFTGINTTMLFLRCKLGSQELWSTTLSRMPNGDELKANLMNPTLTSKLKDAVKSKKAFNFILIIPDGVSRANSVRLLNKSREALIKNGAFDFPFFHSVGVNTLPNILPLFTGFAETELPESGKKFLDEYIPDMLLLEARRQGYLTYHNEDMYYSTFQYVKKGFNHTSADVSAQAFWVHTLHRNEPFCLHNQPLHSIWLDSLKEFTSIATQNDLPFFAFTKLNKLSHDNDKNIKYLDDEMQDFFEDLERKGVLENTLVMYFSDHGARLTAYRKTTYGRYEMRLPMFLLKLPDQFLSDNPEFLANIKANTERLSTFFDVHTTLKYLLSLGPQNSEPAPVLDASNRKVTPPPERGLNLLTQRLPAERTCLQAGIPTSVCICGGYDEIRIMFHNKLAESLGNTSVDFFNNETRKRALSSFCAPLTLKLVTAVRITGDSPRDACIPLDSQTSIRPELFRKTLAKADKTAQDTKSLVCRLSVEIVVEQGDGIFEVSIVRTVKEVVGKSGKAEISVEDKPTWPPYRLNRYGNLSHCLPNGAAAMKPICYCKKQLS